jgi:hypothetical protein
LRLSLFHTRRHVKTIESWPMSLLWDDSAMSKFDLAQTEVLADLFAEARESRDQVWRQKFYTAVPDATLMAFDPQVNPGPDQFPYFHLAIPDPGPLTPFCVTHLLDDALDGGFGIAIFGDSSRTSDPEWVFTYGNLLSYSLFGDFEGDPAERERLKGHEGEKRPAQTEHQVLTAAPSEAYLPIRARKAIAGYMRHWFQHPSPKIALLDDPQQVPSRGLIVNLTLEDYEGDETKLHAAINYLSWYLPATYRIAAMPESWTDSTFVPLD